MIVEQIRERERGTRVKCSGDEEREEGERDVEPGSLGRALGLRQCLFCLGMRLVFDSKTMLHDRPIRVFLTFISFIAVILRGRIFSSSDCYCHGDSVRTT